MAKTIHVHVHGKTKDATRRYNVNLQLPDGQKKVEVMEFPAGKEGGYGGVIKYTAQQRYPGSKILGIIERGDSMRDTKDTPEQTIEYINKFTGQKFTVKVHPDRAFEKLNQLKASWQVASARIIPSSGKDEAPCSCKSHAKDEAPKIGERVKITSGGKVIEGVVKGYNEPMVSVAFERELGGKKYPQLEDFHVAKISKASGGAFSRDAKDAEPPKLKIVVGENDYGKVWHVQAPDGYTYETFSRRVDAVYWLEQFKRANQKSKDTKDATLVNSDKGKIVRLFTGITGKVLEVDENKKRAYVEVQSARNGTYKMWVDFSEVES